MATRFEIGNQTLIKLAAALGLSGKPITAITMVARINEVTRLTVEMLGEADGIEGACTLLREYRLEPKKPMADEIMKAFYKGIDSVESENYEGSWRDKDPLL